MVHSAQLPETAAAVAVWSCTQWGCIPRGQLLLLLLLIMADGLLWQPLQLQLLFKDTHVVCACI